MFNEYFENKRVAVVGNAQSLFNTQYGSEIDDHEVVIRINTPAIFYEDLIPRHSHGTRIHVWAFWDYFRFKTSDDRFRPQKLKDFFHNGKYNLLDLNMTNRHEEFKWNNEFVSCNEQMSKKCILKETGNPSAGLIILSILNQLNPKKVNVYGFDFKRTPTFSNPNHHVDENRFDSFYRHNYQFEEQYTKQKFFTQGKFKLKEI
jgi:hypothetical protein